MVHSDGTPAWLLIARKEMGVRELVGSRHTPRILQYHASTHGKFKDDETAWCSSFVCWCMEAVGVRSTRSARAASWQDWGKPSDLSPGAVILFGKHDPDAKGSGHVGIINAEPVDGWVEVLSGNCANPVISRDGLEESRRRNSRRVWGTCA
jgi:uncharacterized protein (TIGR02594 family)